jgi:hypothetical protein
MPPKNMAAYRLRENLLLFGFFIAASLQAWIRAYREQGFSPRLIFVDRFTLSILMAYWVMCDSSRRGIPKPFIYGVLLIMLWPILATWHVFKTRGWRGFATIGIFLALYCLSVAVPYFVFSFR